jgi:hypothetical protein
MLTTNAGVSNSIGCVLKRQSFRPDQGSCVVSVDEKVHRGRSSFTHKFSDS